MDIGNFRELALEVAACLTAQGKGEWSVAEVSSSGYSPQADLAGPDYAMLRIKDSWGAAGKVTIYGMMLSRYGDRHQYSKRANVDLARGAKTIAGEARRRVLNAGYLDELPAKVAEWQQEQAESEQRAKIMDRASEMFGLEAPGDALLNLSRFLPNKRGQVELSSYGPPTMSIELYGLDPEVGLRMLQVMSASHLVSASCCYRYGPMHHPSLSVTGCLHGHCQHDHERGELGSREAVLQYLVKSHGVGVDEAYRALDEARDSRYQVAEVMDGERIVAVVRWNTGGLGEYTVEIARKDAAS